LKASLETVAFDWGFKGHYYHADSGLHLAPFRAYDAELGRWLSRDPLGEAGGINLYEYALSNPVNFVDPLGVVLAGVELRGGDDRFRHVGIGQLRDERPGCRDLGPVSPFSKLMPMVFT
jgi:RHS repeat-associated protein